MNRIILKEINVRSYFRDEKMKRAQEKINEYIQQNNLEVIAASLIRENEDEYFFTLTVR